MKEKYVISRAEAAKRLTRRWQDQIDKIPHTRHGVSLELYIKRNLRAVRTYGSLEEFSSKE